MEDYSDDFASYARDFLNTELEESERIDALKAAIHACMGEGEEADEEEGAEKKPAAGLALVFGGPKKKKG
jgi:hypothetical protein